MKKFRFIMLIFCCIVLLIGCAEERILERISLPTLIGYDYDQEERKITTTAVIRQVNPEFESRIEVQSDTAATSKGTRIKQNLKTAKKIMAGQLRVILFSEDLAKYGLEGAVHTTSMNSEISTSVYLAVVEGETKPLIEYQYSNIKDIGQHIFNILDQNIEKQHAVSSTLHEVSRDLYSPTTDMALPMIKREDQSISLTHIGLFHKAKMVGKLPIEDVPYIMMLRKKFENGTLEIKLQDGSYDEEDGDAQPIQQVAIDSIHSKKSMEIVNPDTPEINVKIDISCRLLEVHRSINISKEGELKKLEDEVNKEIKSQLEKVVQYGQEVGSDIFGFGDFYASHTRNRNLSEDEWNKLFKNMKVNITTEVKILRNGVFE